MKIVMTPRECFMVFYVQVHEDLMQHFHAMQILIESERSEIFMCFMDICINR